MNKKIIFGAVGAVSLIGGIIAGIIHRSNKKARIAEEALDAACDLVHETTELVEETLDFLIFERAWSDFNDEEEDGEDV